MSDPSVVGVLYTEYASLSPKTSIASLWTYETRQRGPDRRSVAFTPCGNHEYWLDRSDPLLNTILPGMGVSLIINFADAWTTGRSLATSGLLPHACVVGPVTQSRILGLGRSVRATGAVILPELTSAAFGVPASELVDQIVPLEDLWTRDEVEHFFAALAPLDAWRGPSLVKHELIARIGRPGAGEPVGQTAPRLIQLHAGRVSIDGMAKSHGLSRKQFARRFTAAAGVPPKLFARVTRFQRLVHTLLTTDVSRWACVPASMGLCDQAHMINEFHAFAGSSPTSFFRPHGIQVDPGTVQVRGRPSEWLRESTS